MKKPGADRAWGSQLKIRGIPTICPHLHVLIVKKRGVPKPEHPPCPRSATGNFDKRCDFLLFTLFEYVQESR